ncbi:MAG: hypothetical protein K0U72_03230 [Gammaproteobacteria bacterium]|nr:hypothetical protein [Gammaproteobacteria bacterium]
MLYRLRNAVFNPAWICFLWVGITVGVSMIATPVRFTAETITRPIALDIGRVVFAALNKVELVALLLLLVVVRLSGRTAQLWAFCGALALIVLAQSVWLTPELTERTQIIIDGGVPPKSYAHAIYSSLELVKIGLLLTLGFRALSESDGSTGTR